MSPLNRREFVAATVAGGAGLVVGFYLPHGRSKSEGTFSPNAYLRITPDNKVTIVVARSEMGRAATALPMILAEELEADWKQIEIEQAGASTLYGDQTTGGSASVKNHVGSDAQGRSGRARDADFRGSADVGSGAFHLRCTAGECRACSIQPVMWRPSQLTLHSSIAVGCCMHDTPLLAAQVERATPHVSAAAEISISRATAPALRIGSHVVFTLALPARGLISVERARSRLLDLNLLQSASSSSARIMGSAVRTPCPISERATTIVTLFVRSDPQIGVGLRKSLRTCFVHAAGKNPRPTLLLRPRSPPRTPAD